MKNEWRYYFERMETTIMSEKWFWLSDWAANLEIWEDDLVEASSESNHTFISFEQLMKQPKNLYTSIAGLKNADCVVAWGLGSLCFMLSAKDRPAKQKWILLAPVFDFCDEDGGWTKRNVEMLARQVTKANKPTLEIFLELLGPCDEQIQEQWMEKALKMNPETLALGLDFLCQNKIDEPLENKGETIVYYGREDQIILPVLAKKASSVIPSAKFQERPKSGHWPHTLIL